jgi:hypothetical protein
MPPAEDAGWHDVRVVDRGDVVEVRGPRSPSLFFGGMLAVFGLSIAAGVAQGTATEEIDPGGVVFFVGWVAMMLGGLVSVSRVAIAGGASGLTVGTIWRRHLAWDEIASIDVPLLHWNGVSRGLWIRRVGRSKVRAIGFAFKAGHPTRAELYDVAVLLASLPTRFDIGPPVEVRIEQVSRDWERAAGPSADRGPSEGTPRGV